MDDTTEAIVTGAAAGAAVGALAHMNDVDLREGRPISWKRRHPILYTALSFIWVCLMIVFTGGAFAGYAWLSGWVERHTDLGGGLIAAVFFFAPVVVVSVWRYRLAERRWNLDRWYRDRRPHG